MTQPDDTGLDHIRQLGEELRAVFTAERAAIAALDHVRLGEIAVQKRHVADQLVAVRDRAAPSREVRDLFAAIQIEARATAMLAAAATEAVRALLGTESTGYDRHARSTAVPSLRLLARY
jgi:hypothetical protein